MGASRCTEGQLTVIGTLDRPLMVSAGAGSGKTFTLTQRVARALESGAISSIEQVCAITFTNAAAAELRSRIKGLLMAQGMEEQARLTDGAWISTIHAMAARMLRENAFAVGLDPAFEVIGSMERDLLLRRALDQAATEAAQADDVALRRLVSGEPLFGRGGNARGVMDDVMDLLARARTMPAGLEGVVLPQAPRGQAAILADLAAAARALTEAADASPDDAKKDAAFFEELRAGMAAAASASDADALPAERFWELLHRFPHTSKLRKGKGNAALMEAYGAYRCAYAQLSEEVECTLGAQRAGAIAALARRVERIFRELKGPARLDNDDLLRLCYEMLSQRAELAARYRERFALIMIDEFQDTDLLQTAIVAAIARPDMSNVCTVGDAQQSIYRFRGADVNVFLGFRRDLFARNRDALAVELPDNFRSHGDVLKMVDAIFARPGMFGDAFLHLEAKGAINGQPDELFAALPRVSVDVVHYQRKTAGPTATAADARAVAAAHIAERFAELQRAGAAARDMALLLGGMTHAQVYADALRAVGLESRIVAGSVFQQTPEARIARAALRFARDARDEEALLELLLSPLFAVSDDALLAMASCGEEGQLRRAPLSNGLLAPDERAMAALSADDQRMIEHARTALLGFAAAAQAGDAGAALRGLLAESGLLDRLGAQGAAGLASAGNFEKACRLAESLEVASCGIAELSDRFCEHLRLEKETPGLLTPEQGDHVTIMTVHGSKGLEFAHVAVAELSGKRAPEAAFAAENIEGRTYAAGKARPAGADGARADALKRLRPERQPAPIEGAAHPYAAFIALCAHRSAQEEAEAKRLLYVGLTRAVRSIHLSLTVQGDPAKGYDSDFLAEGVHEAFPWSLDAPDSVSMMGFGGEGPARVSFAHLPVSAQMPAAVAEEADEGDGAQGCAEPFLVARRCAAAPVVVPGCASSRDGMVSYTSLAAAQHPDDALAADEMADVATLTEPPSPESATALGTAFHRLAQQAIVRARASGERAPAMPSAQDLAAQAASCALSSAQRERLARAVELWFGSAQAAAFFAYPDIRAEVPFSVAAGQGAARFYLVGEIDGLASDGEHAFLIDYKTGGSPHEEPAALHAKHLMQARCYAFALLSSGYASVRADFLRVEQPAADGGPQQVSYAFEAADLPELEAVIAAAQADAAR